MTNPVAVKLAYDVFEPVNGADDSLSPVIFMHGMASTKEHWKDIPQIIADKTRRKAYAIDARNHGDSTYTEEFNFDLNVDDLFHFMDTINVPKAILVGHSMGGVTSTKAALLKPERVEMVFCEDMHTKRIPQEFFSGMSEIVKMWLKSVENIPMGTNPAEAKNVAIDILVKSLPKENRAFFDEQKLRDSPLRLKQTPDGTYDVLCNKDVLFRAIENVDTLMSEPSGRYIGPAYFMYGTLSPLRVDKEEENIKKHFPNMELVKFEGASHDVHSEFPEKYIDTILQCLI